MRSLEVSGESFPLARTFAISRGAKTAADVIVATIADGSRRGRGECVPYPRYGESPASVRAAIESAKTAIEAGLDRKGLQELLPPGAARNALDCALWDLEAKMAGRPVFELAGAPPPRPVVTAFTISLASPEEMAAQARENAWRPLLKIKVGATGDADRIRAVKSAAPQSRIILDANEGWSAANIEENLDVAAGCGAALVEQPLPAGDDAMLAGIRRRVPVCADESVHVTADLAGLVGRYDAVNIKLDKAGGLTEALAMRRKARALGLGIMVGCMVGSSLAMAPAALVAQDADFVDLDGPLLLARDRVPGLAYEGSAMSVADPALWG